MPYSRIKYYETAVLTVKHGDDKCSLDPVTILFIMLLGHNYIYMIGEMGKVCG